MCKFTHWTKVIFSLESIGEGPQVSLWPGFFSVNCGLERGVPYFLEMAGIEDPSLCVSSNSASMATVSLLTCLGLNKCLVWKQFYSDWPSFVTVIGLVANNCMEYSKQQIKKCGCKWPLRYILKWKVHECTKYIYCSRRGGRGSTTQFCVPSFKLLATYFWTVLQYTMQFAIR